MEQNNAAYHQHPPYYNLLSHQNRFPSSIHISRHYRRILLLSAHKFYKFITYSESHYF